MSAFDDKHRPTLEALLEPGGEKVKLMMMRSGGAATLGAWFQRAGA